MNKGIVILILIFGSLNISAQTELDSIDYKYLEDQIYLTLTYNILQNKPLEVSQNGFSGGMGLGFIKDFPINKERSIGFGLGAGYSYGVFVQNMKIAEVNGITEVSLAEDYSINKFTLHAIEVPLELRWRNSSATKYKFWRVYGGLKLEYVFSFDSKFTDDVSTVKTKNITEVNKFQTGIYVSAGYSTWNLYFYYGLNPIFNDLSLDGEDISMKEINIGLKFYIL
ncbi:porin family protein [Lutibacter sp.]|uniref:porin family protein n=1 Tax=Lutibacter sp. TaxID=1925666 RepID=UPI0035651D73